MSSQTQNKCDTNSDESFYIEAKLSNSEEIISLRDEIYQYMPQKSSYYKVDPHITIIPKFSINCSFQDQLNKTISNLNMTETEITCHGLSVWPSLHNPRVILIDVSWNIEDERANLLNVIQECGGKVYHNPVSTHITLFKSQSNISLVDFEQEELQNLIAENRENWKTTVQYVDLVHIPTE